MSFHGQVSLSFIGPYGGQIKNRLWFHLYYCPIGCGRRARPPHRQVSLARRRRNGRNLHSRARQPGTTNHPRAAAVTRLDLNFPSACESYNIIRIILLPDLTKPIQMATIHPLQRCSKQRIVHVRRRILQVLSVPNPGLDQRRSRKTYGICHDPVDRCIISTDRDEGWEDSKGAIWWVRG